MTRIAFFPIIAAIILSLIGCDTKGEPGPQGPPGVSGMNGLNGAPGPEGNPGQDGQDINPLDLEDEDNTRIGPFLGFGDADSTTTFTTVDANDGAGVKRVPAMVNMDGSLLSVDVAFDTSDCTGNTYLMFGTNGIYMKAPSPLKHFAFRGGGKFMKATSQVFLTYNDVSPMSVMLSTGECLPDVDAVTFGTVKYLSVAEVGSLVKVPRGPLHVKAR